MDIPDSEGDATVFDRALDLLRGLVPAALFPDAPVPDRTVLCRIHISEISGRSA